MATRHVLLLDACVAINLQATNSFDEIAIALDMQFWMVRPASEEVGSLRDEVNGQVVVVPIDLGLHEAAGTLVIIDLEAGELSKYVELAREVDDGEAASIAVAVGRGLEIATDDRKARRVCSDLGLPEPMRTTQLVRDYCDRQTIAVPEIGKILRSVRDRASFVPPRADPNVKWWGDRIGE